MQQLDLFEENISIEEMENEIAELEQFIQKKGEEQNQFFEANNAFDWAKEFPQVCNSEGNFEGFDAVIGNPPYFALAGSKLNSYYEEFYETFSKGTDIYCLFIERALQLLKENCNFSFIVSNKWLTTKYGEKTREFLLKNTKNLTILNLNKLKVFDKATVDTAVIAANQSFEQQKSIKIANYKDFIIEDLNKLSKYKFDYQIFEPKPFELWNTLGLTFGTIKEKIEHNSTKLVEVDNIQFYRGITTGFNDAFIINNETKDKLINENPKCAEIIKPLVRGRDIKKYTIYFPDLWIINTHNGLKNEKIKRISLEKKYENILNYLKLHETKLKKRVDVGDEWYNLRNCKYLPLFEKNKIVFTKASKQQSFAYDTNNYYLLNTSYFISGENLKYLLGVLNSKLINFAFKNFYQSGGIEGEMSLQAIENFPIKFSKSIENKIIKLVDKILLLKKENSENDISKIEQQIDNEIYKLYNLTEDEIKIIESEKI